MPDQKRPGLPRATSPFASLISGVAVVAKKAKAGREKRRRGKDDADKPANWHFKSAPKKGDQSKRAGAIAPGAFHHLRPSEGQATRDAPAAQERATSFADEMAAASKKAADPNRGRSATPPAGTFAARMAAALKKAGR